MLYCISKYLLLQECTAVREKYNNGIKIYFCQNHDLLMGNIEQHYTKLPVSYWTRYKVPRPPPTLMNE